MWLIEIRCLENDSRASKSQIGKIDQSMSETYEVLSVPLGKLDELEEALSASLDDDAACCCDVDLVIAAGADGKSDCSNREEETRVVEEKCLKYQKWPNCEP